MITYAGGDTAGVPLNGVTQSPVRMEPGFDPPSTPGKMLVMDLFEDRIQRFILIYHTQLIPHGDADAPGGMQQLVIRFDHIIDRNRILNVYRHYLGMFIGHHLAEILRKYHFK